MASRIYKNRDKDYKPPARKSLFGSKDKVKDACSDPSAGAGSIGAGKTQPPALVTSDGLALDKHLGNKEEVLRQFDLNLKFGPCIGITRLQRWERAKKQGLNPPTHIKDILERAGAEDKACLWEKMV